MKKAIGLLLFINLLLLFGIMSLLKDNVETEEREINIETEDAVELMKFFLPKGEFKDSAVISATCVQENAQKALDVPVQKNFEIKVKKGETCKAGDVLMTADGKEIKLEADARILDYVQTKESVTIQYLDFSEMWLEAYVPLSVFQNLSYESEVQVIVEDEEYEGKIVWLDWQVNGGEVLVRMQSEVDVLPGTEVSVALVKKVYQDVVFVGNSYIMEDNVGTYLYYYEEDEPDAEPQKVYLKVLNKGEKYSIIEIDEGYVNGYMYTEYCY